MRALISVFLQAAGIVTVVVAGFVVSAGVGTMAVGAAAVYIGLALEDI